MAQRDPEPGERFDLAAAWPGIAARLDRVLVARKVPSWQREDIVQETALRLVERRHKLDPARSIEGLAVTVALNLLRDDYRAAKRVSSEVVPELPGAHDVEAVVLARLEVSRVGKALRGLSAMQRETILMHLEDEPAGASKSSLRMMRMRARRRLNSLVDKAEIFVVASRARLGRIVPSPESGCRHAASWPGESPVGAAAVLVLTALIAHGPSGHPPAPAAPIPWATATGGPAVALESPHAAKMVWVREVVRDARPSRRPPPAAVVSVTSDLSTGRSAQEAPADISVDLGQTSARVEDPSGGSGPRARVQSGRTFVEINP